MALKVHVTLRSVFLVILLSIMKIVIGAEEDRSCPHYGLNFRGRCFWFVDISTSWYEAGHLCRRLYGDRVTLVTIKDKETNDFIRSQWQRGFWIGLHEAHGETIWRWLDNTEPANGNYQNWEGGATPPSRYGNRNCGLMKPGSPLWTDYDCGSNAFFVCAELPSAPMCPHGGIFFRDRCFWRGTRQLSWEAANQACQDDFGPETRLAVARDAETNLFLSRLAGRYIWLGLSDRTEEGVWKWIDGAPLEYQKWAYNEPNNQGGNENCATLKYPDARWNDLPCGDPVSESDRVTTTMSYICAIPPCYEAADSSGDEPVTVSNQEVQIIDHSICARTECTQHCVNGGACNSTGQCICSKQYPGMTCNLDEWEVEMENELVNTTTGSTLTLKCKVNLPVDHISSLTWSKCEPAFLPQYRLTITDSLSQGYSILQISDVSFSDAGQYHCKVVLSFRDTTIPVARTTLVNVTEGSTPVPTTKLTSERTTTEESRTSQPVSTTTPVTKRTTTRETSTPLSTTNPTTERTTLKGTSTPLSTTKPTTERTTLKEGSTPVPTTKLTSERTTTEESRTSQPVSTTTPVTKRTTTRGTSTPLSTTKPTTERTTLKAFEETFISPSKLTVGRASTKQEERTRKEIQNKSAQRYDNRPAGGTSALIVILFITTTLLLVTVVVLMKKIKSMERRSSEESGLIELNENP
ncbi:C-type mannose receptor 2 [Holothuria leucospilota]|uniref:C-type mannose receptor 2 n=1 Tax=Holothuria leucospilota TaxID=206669 RepID=A0A9Q1BJF3_HOLLE|nr:C-type mannose receptor 2 [Holothuria leucospilota]